MLLTARKIIRCRNQSGNGSIFRIQFAEIKPDQAAYVTSFTGPLLMRTQISLSSMSPSILYSR